MTLTIVAKTAPLQTNEDSVILVGKTRVTLEVRLMNQARFDPQGLRDHLLARTTDS